MKIMNTRNIFLIIALCIIDYSVISSAQLLCANPRTSYATGAGDGHHNHEGPSPNNVEILGNGFDDNYDGLVDVLPYCTPYVSDPCVSTWITNVSLVNINNSSTCGSGGYSDFTDLTASLEPGTNYTISISCFWGNSGNSRSASLYVDWNRDGDFEDSGERVNNIEFPYWGYPGFANTSIPGNATGSYTMRVIVDFFSVQNSCTIYVGEAEDYTIQVTPLCADMDGDGYYPCHGDCDDTNPDVHHDATEICDGIDNNCNGTTDEGLAIVYYTDADGDGYGVANSGQSLCENPGAGYVTQAGDCNDTNPNTYHGAVEILDNGIDDNCDGLVDVMPYCTPYVYSPCEYNWITNISLAGINNYSNCGSGGYSDFTALTTSLEPGTTYSIFITGSTNPEYGFDQLASVYVDWNRNGNFEDSGERVASDIYLPWNERVSGSIAVPRNATGNYTMRVISDYYLSYYYSNSCSVEFGEAEDYSIQIICHSTTYFRDSDSDGYGDPAVSIVACTAPNGFVVNNDDCDDGNENVNPGVAEVHDGIDNDCDGFVDNLPSTRHFLTLWNTSNPGSSSTTVVFPGDGTNYSIYWEDASNPATNGTLTGNGTTTITFPAAGTYKVYVTPGAGTFNRFNMNGGTDRRKLLDVNQWGTIEWTSMGTAFEGCENMSYTATDNPDLSGVTDMSAMFGGARSFNGNIGSWDVSNVTNMRDMFDGARSFNQYIGNWNVSKVTDMWDMFEGAITFNQDLNNWNVSKVTNMNAMFALCTAFNGNISNWNVSNVTNMEYMFLETSNFNQNISNWDVSKVTNMEVMFYGAASFNQPIGNWNTATVTNMGGMFDGATSFNQPIGNWNTAAVTNMGGMFDGATSFNQPIGNWNTATVTNMGGMFHGATSFNQPIGNWNTAAVTNMGGMFDGATSFNQPIGNWNTAAVRYMSFMFHGATSFNQPIGNWNTAAVRDMDGMFDGATSFNQPIGNWALDPYVDMYYMLDNCGMDCPNYSTTLIGWANNPATPFGRELGATGRQYGTNATGARTTLTATKGWDITGDNPAGTYCSTTPPFITTWNTSNPGSSNTTVVFPGVGANYTIYWENVSNPATNGALAGNGTTTITFPAAGTYKVYVTPGAGTFTRFNMDYGTDRLKLIQLNQWGNIAWANMARTFAGCHNLTSTATDIPDLTSVTNMFGMFYQCRLFNGAIGNWNVSNVTNMGEMFVEAAAFNQPIGNWNVANVTNMAGMFADATSFNQPIGTWNMVSATNIRNMFIRATSFNQPIGNWNVANVTDMLSMFAAATSFNQPLGNWNVTNVTNMFIMFGGASAFNQNLGAWTLNPVVDISGMLTNCGMDCANYSATLIGWNANPATPNGRSLGASGRKYGPHAVAARNNLTGAKGWTITGDKASDIHFANLPAGGYLGINPTPPVCNTNVTASDEDGNALTVSCVPGDVVTFRCTHTQTFTYSATNCGQTTTEEVTYSWTVDTEAPTIICSPQSIIFNGQETIALNTADLVQFSDNCGIASISLSPDFITCEQLGQTVPVIVTVTDENNNVSTCTANVTVAGFPCGWSSESGSIGCNSDAIYSSATGLWSIEASSCFYGAPYTVDYISFIQRTLCGNGSITALVASINGNGWAGVVMRESNAPGAKKAQLMTNLSQFHRREFRTAANGQAFPQQIPSNGRYWLRIVRAGNQFSMFASPNGTSWFLIGSQSIIMGNCIDIGLVATNYTTNSTVTATFEGVSYTGTNVTAASHVLPASSLESPYHIAVYPNPTDGELNLDLTQYIGRSVRIELYSIEGKLLQFREIEEVQTTMENLNLLQYAGGMYFVKIKSRNLPDATRRVVLQRE